MTGFFNTIILLGAIQGLIFSMLLFRRNDRRLQHRCLAWLLLLMAMASFNLYFYNTGFFESTTALRVISAIVPLVVVMPIGPLIYFYIRSSLDPAFRLQRKHRLQFYTAIIDMGSEIAAIIFIAGFYLGFKMGSSQSWGLFIDNYNKYADIPRWLSMTIYVWLSFRLLKEEKKKIARASGSHPTISWLSQFIAAFLIFQAIWFIYLVPYIHPVYSDRLLNLVDWYPVYIPLAVLIYWLGIRGYFFDFSAGEKKKKTGSPLPGRLLEETTAILIRAMESDRLFLKQDLSLDALAEHTGLAAKTISAVVNQHLQKSFNEWVNGYRVEEFKKRIREGRLGQLTISAIAFECGFNSQPTFQRTFKQLTGMTPTDFVKKSSELPAANASK